MDENSYIECRKDVQENILTLYSYLQNEEEEYYYEWAKERLSQGRNFVAPLNTQRKIIRARASGL